MSGNYEANIEVYFHLDESIKEKIIDKIKICNNKKCAEYNMKLPEHINFCNCCGTKIIEKETNERNEVPCCHEFGNKYFNDDFLFRHWNYKDQFWFLQKNIEGTQHLRFDSTSEDELPLSDIDFKAELELYKADTLIQSILAKFDELYGEGKVEIKIGLFPNYN